MDNKKLRKTIYGDYTNNAAGYCKLHQRVITPRQLNGKGCVKRNCWYLVKYENHEIWKNLEGEE